MLNEDELVTEVMSRVYKYLCNLDRQDVGGFHKWLSEMVRRTSLELFKQMSKLTKYESLDGLAEMLADPSSEESNELDRRHAQLVAIKEIEDKTRPENWRTFVAYHIDGRDVDEIAEQMGISPSAVYKRAARVLGRIRRLANGFGGYPS